jgi:hypothetical protein
VCRFRVAWLRGCAGPHGGRNVSWCQVRPLRSGSGGAAGGRGAGPEGSGHGVRVLRLVTIGAALAAGFAAAGPAGPAAASSGEVVIAVTTGSGLQVGEQANGSPWQIQTVATGLVIVAQNATWSDTRISGISYPLDTPAIAAN